MNMLQCTQSITFAVKRGLSLEAERDYGYTTLDDTGPGVIA